MVKNKFYVTTPIYYVNSEPHIGSAYTTILADVFARWHRLKEENVFFLTGTDEHGQKIQQIAKENKTEPKEFVDKIAKKFQETFKLLNISNDFFIRTTNPKHEEEVSKILQELYDKKFIYKGEYEALYCVGCEQYLNKSDLVDGKCPLHKKEPEIIKEEAYMFKLSAFQDKLLKLIETGEFEILPMKRRNEVVSFLKTGLQDISISRKKEKVSWGIELPFDKNHSCYVWIEALLNYVTGLKINNKFKDYWPCDLQLMANDILRIHATIWPALLLALKYKLPKTLYIHGYFTVNGQKMSKSLGNAVSPVYLAEKYGVDAIRYFLIREIPFGDDGDFNENALKERLNNELANELGNLVSRTLNLVEKFGEVKKEKQELKFEISNIDKLILDLKINQALNEIWRLVQDCNRYVNEKKPWELNGKEKEIVLYNLLEGLRIVSILLYPFIPETCEKINKQLGIKNGNLKECEFGLIKSYKSKKGEILFRKIENK